MSKLREIMKDDEIFELYKNITLKTVVYQKNMSHKTLQKYSFINITKSKIFFHALMHCKPDEQKKMCYAVDYCFAVSRLKDNKNLNINLKIKIGVKLYNKKESKSIIFFLDKHQINSIYVDLQDFVNKNSIPARRYISNYLPNYIKHLSDNNSINYFIRRNNYPNSMISLELVNKHYLRDNCSRIRLVKLIKMPYKTIIITSHNIEMLKMIKGLALSVQKRTNKHAFIVKNRQGIIYKYNS
jgi:hypothetical protein